MKVIKIAKDFSERPGARYVDDGPNSGEDFREKFLKPHFLENPMGKILIDLDDTEGYATSFLEEAFGGIQREFPSLDILKLIDFKSTQEESLPEEIMGYIKDAKAS